MVPGIVLAAGRSERMGREKALLEAGGESFLARTVTCLREGGCDRILVVVRAGAPRLEEAVESAGARVVRNDARRSQQIDSIRLGLHAAPSVSTAAIILPVDHPLIQPTTVARLIATHRAHPAAIVRPLLSGRPGHPTLFSRSVWPALSDPELPRGAESVVESPDVERIDIEVDDAGILADIDTPEAYERYLGQGPLGAGGD